jgi:hypothetical protein
VWFQLHSELRETGHDLSNLFHSAAVNTAGVHVGRRSIRINRAAADQATELAAGVSLLVLSSPAVTAAE